MVRVTDVLFGIGREIERGNYYWPIRRHGSNENPASITLGLKTLSHFCCQGHGTEAET